MWGEGPGAHHDWLDGDAGPVVRPFAVTAGRARPAAAGFDLVAFVVAGPPAFTVSDLRLQPEHRAILTATQQPVSVAELASRLDLALGVVRVLLGDLLADGLIARYEPQVAASFPDDNILKAVVNGLRAL